MLRIRKISRNEVAVYISEQELVGYDIKTDGKVPESAALHKFLFKLMDTVYDKTGFDPYGGQVVVEATPLKHGMSFNISKVKRKLSKDEFKKVKKINVKTESFDDISDMSQDDFLDMLESITDKKIRAGRNQEECGVFVFYDFSELESALCELPDEAIEGCGLYRNMSRYALVSDYLPGSRFYNMISEFAPIVDDSSIIADDISEGWKLIAANEDLTAMAIAVREMQ